MGTIQNARKGQKMNEIKEEIMSLFFLVCIRNIWIYMCGSNSFAA